MISSSRRTQRRGADRECSLADGRYETPLTKRELLQLGELIFAGLAAGSIAIEKATDQAAVKNKSFSTLEDLLGVVLSGRFTHEFRVAVVQAWEGSSASASVRVEAYRAIFVSELLRLVPHEDDVVASRPVPKPVISSERRPRQ